MKQILTGKEWDGLVAHWVSKRTGGEWGGGACATVGLLEPQKGLIAGVLYEDFNGSNLLMHVAAVPGASWMTRDFLWYCFYYPFVELGCRRVTGIVPSSNRHALEFDRKLGFTLEATLKDAHPDGDLCVLKMTREDCRWLNIRKGNAYGQGITTPDSRLHGSGDCNVKLGEVRYDRTDGVQRLVTPPRRRSYESPAG